jgi:hypothetical protein
LRGCRPCCQNNREHRKSCDKEGTDHGERVS